MIDRTPKLADEAKNILLSQGLKIFRLEHLMGMLNVKRSVASKVVTHLKKTGFLHPNDDNWFSDVCHRGWRLFVLKTSPRTVAMELQHERRGLPHKRHTKPRYQ